MWFVRAVHGILLKGEIQLKICFTLYDIYVLVPTWYLFYMCFPCTLSDSGAVMRFPCAIHGILLKGKKTTIILQYIRSGADLLFIYKYLQVFSLYCILFWCWPVVSPCCTWRWFWDNTHGADLSLPGMSSHCLKVTFISRFWFKPLLNGDIQMTHLFFISQPIPYARTCSSYECFVCRVLWVTNSSCFSHKCVSYNALKKFYGRYVCLFWENEVLFPYVKYISGVRPYTMTPSDQKLQTENIFLFTKLDLFANLWTWICNSDWDTFCYRQPCTYHFEFKWILQVNPFYKKKMYVFHWMPIRVSISLCT